MHSILGLLDTPTKGEYLLNGNPLTAIAQNDICLFQIPKEFAQNAAFMGLFKVLSTQCSKAPLAKQKQPTKSMTGNPHPSF